ncbi:MAG: pyridoxal phosphate-dependent aminotransferase [Candidatus Fermentibacteraceae bacterium]|nr:pyridoxal phosphate-dependent aminotransferase [Candidatus Fermentibacteraceae bacterium]
MNSFSPSGRMKAVVMPPIARIMERISGLRREGGTVYSMAQAVPWYAPPEHVLSELSARLGDPSLHGYSPDPGFMTARTAVADDFHRRRGIRLDPSSELHLTCGASQAFLSALLSVTSAGDRVAVIEPYYFDHVFAIRFSDLELVSLPMAETEAGWTLPVDDLGRIMGTLKALVIVNPGNPTGSVIPDARMRELAELSRENGTFLIIDETYERFNYTRDRWHPWMDGRPGNVLTLGSFSKSLGMPGWRLGYLFGPEELLRHALKVQDSVVICPPAPSQRLLEMVIGEQEWIEEMSMGVRTRLHRCRSALSGNGQLHWRDAGGAFFTLAAYEGSMNSEEAAMHLLDEYGIGTIPGSAFGPAGEKHLRISFGCLSREELDPAMEILSQVSFPR